jgi:MFS family permease
MALDRSHRRAPAAASEGSPVAPVPDAAAAPIAEAAPATPIPVRGLRHAFRALRHRDFALFWTGALISSTGMWMQNVTVPFVLHEATGSAAWVGFGAFLQFAPALLVGPVGGVFADRFPRRRILLVSQSIAMTMAFLLWVSVSDGQTRPGVIVVLVAVSGFAAGFGIPAWQSFVPELVPRASLLNAVALNSAQFNASRALGFMVGGITLYEFGPGVAFLANGVSYLAVLGALMAVSAGRQPVTHRRGGGSFRLAIAYVGERPGLRLAVIAVGIVAFLGSPVIQLAPVFARDEFGVDERAYGFLAAALGIGATLGSVLLGAYGDGLARSRLTVGALFAYGVAVVGMGLTPAYAGGLAAMLVIGLGYLVIVSALNTSVQVAVDDRYRGRVLALYAMAFTGGYPLGSLLQGWLADIVGVRPVVTGAGLALILYAAWLMSRPLLVASLDTGGERAPFVRRSG